MKYIFLAYGDEKQLAVMSPNERDGFEHACLINEQVLRQGDYLLAVADLQDSSIVTTVQIQNGKVTLASGACVKPKEQLIKLFFINARDLNEAIRLAAQMPYAQRGGIEVRPMMEQ